MKKLKPVYIVICILLILFFCTACIFTQCSKAIPGFVANVTSTESNGFPDSSPKTQADEISGLNENETGLAENTGKESENSGDLKQENDGIDNGTTSAVKETGDTGYGLDGTDSASDWDNYSLPGITGEETNFKITYEFLISGDTDSVVFTTCIPADYKYRQKILDYGFSVKPDRIFTDDGNKYATFKLIHPVNKFFISIDIQMELFDFDLLAAQKTPDNLFENKSQLAEYLVSEEYIEADDPRIKAAADSFDNTGQLGIVKEIYSFVLDHMQYSGYNPSDIGAAAALACGSGDCTEYSDLFVALCRAKGIPARVIEGYGTDSSPGDLSLGHSWTEVYLDDFGWVPFDPIYDDNNGSSVETAFENLKNIYVYSGFKRHDDILSGYHYYTYNYYGDAVDVKKIITSS